MKVGALALLVQIGAAEFSRFLQADTPTQFVETRCVSWCRDERGMSRSWEFKCSQVRCMACSECFTAEPTNVPTNSPTQFLNPTTTTAITPTPQCQSWCDTHSAEWSNKCAWVQATCSACTPCSAPTTTTTTKSLEELRDADARKKRKAGLICGDEVCRHAFQSAVSWHYTYQMMIKDPDTITWLNENQIEWVPMNGRPVAWSTPYGSCTWVKPKGGWSPARMCDARSIVDSVNATNIQLTGAAKAKYLMLFNEAYLDCSSSQCMASTIEPVDVVELWRRYFIPAASSLGMNLVSPTLKGDSEKYQMWAAEIFAKCYELKDAPEFPCDVSSFKKLSVHAYQCSEKYYNDYYARDGPFSWKNDLIEKIQTRLGHSQDSFAFFRDFFDNTPVWLTEFSCAADGNYNGYPNGFDDPYGYGQAPYAEQCRRASGQAPTSHGKGVIKTLTDMDEFERFAWFGLVVNADVGDTYVGAGNALITKDGVLMPPGRVMNADYSGLSTLNCTMPVGVDTEGDGNGGTDNPDKN